MIHTVDILGSCVCRDAFNKLFVDDYAESFKVNTYVPRVPIPVLISQKCDYNFEALKKECETPWRYECFFKMCERNSLDALINNGSEILLLDFYTDAQFGIAVTEDGNCNVNNGFVRRLKSLNSRIIDYYNYEHNPEEYFKIWSLCFDYFMMFCLNHTAYKKIIVNGIKGTNVIKDGDRFSYNIPNEQVDEINRMWKRMDEYARTKWNIPVIDYKKAYYLDRNYVFGGVSNEIVHYEKAYYRDFFSKLKSFSDIDNDKGFCNEKTETINLVRNNSFQMGDQFWDHTNAIFRTDSIDGENWLVPVKPKNGTQIPYVWLWSNPIEINADGTTVYTLMFDCIINDVESLLTDSLFGVRLFKNAIESEYKEAIKIYSIRKKNEHNEVGKKYRYVFKFSPIGKYIRIAPHCSCGRNNISYANICLVKGESEVYSNWFDKGINFGNIFRHI